MVPRANTGAGAGAGRRGFALRSSTVLLLLAMLCCGLRATGAGPPLQHFSATAALLIVGLAPVWAMLAGMLSSIYLVLGMWRPYSTVQHLAEMALAVALTAAMQPPA